MRRLIAAFAAVLAGGSLAVGCASTLPDPYATNEQIRAPWRAEPLSVSPATISAASQACEEVRTRVGRDQAAIDRLVAVDARGAGRLTVLFAGAGQAFMECELRMDAGGQLSMNGGSVQGGGGLVVFLDPDDIEIVSSAGMVGAGDASTAVYGRIGPAITAVRLVFSGGSIVRASIGGGWFVAWWPTDEMGFVVEGYDATGRKIAEVAG